MNTQTVAESIEQSNTPRTIRILSIDAWRDGDGGWTWNNWHAVGMIVEPEFNAFYAKNGWQLNVRALLRWMRNHAYLSEASKGAVAVEDDQYNVVILDRNTQEPLFAIEYGALLQ